MAYESLMVFTGNANPKLAADVVKRLNISLGRATVGRFSDGEVQVEELVKGGDHYRMTVRDNGPGIPKAHLGKALGQMLAGTKFHRYVQQRGQRDADLRPGRVALEPVEELLLTPLPQGRAHLVVHVDVARILADVGHANGVTRGRSAAGNPLPQRDAPVLDHILAVADGEAKVQFLRARIEQEHSENFVVNQAADHPGGAGEDLVEIERVVDLLADFDEGLQDFRGNFQLQIAIVRIHSAPEKKRHYSRRRFPDDKQLVRHRK